MMKRIWIALIVLASAFPAPAQEPSKTFRAGAYATNITPPLGQKVVGGWAPFPCTNIHDELHARCLAVDDGTTQMVFVVVDNVGVPREVFDQARTWIAEETKLPPQNVLMSSTHTHSATTARGSSAMGGDPLFEYQRFLARRIADGVRCALNNLEPARIGWGSVKAPEHVFNRRWHMKDGPELNNPFGGRDKVRMNPPRGHKNLIKPAGPVDPEVSFLSVQSKDGRPIALLANYGLHYVGGVGKGDVSADYFAIFADRVQELMKADRKQPPFVGIMTNGTSGDVNNIDFVNSRPRRKRYEQMTIVGRDVAEKVAAAVKEIEYHDWVPVATRTTELTLKVRKPSPELLERANKLLELGDKAEVRQRRELAYARRSISLSKAPDTVSIPLQAVRLGDLGIVGIPFETFTEIGLEIKKRTPFGRSFVVSFGNGSYGYLPTPEQHELGGYETWLGTNRVEFQASRKITDRLLEMLNGLKAPN